MGGYIYSRVCEGFTASVALLWSSESTDFLPQPLDLVAVPEPQSNTPSLFPTHSAYPPMMHNLEGSCLVTKNQLVQFCSLCRSLVPLLATFRELD